MVADPKKLDPYLQKPEKSYLPYTNSLLAERFLVSVPRAGPKQWQKNQN
jgi:hypothetical protein